MTEVELQVYIDKTEIEIRAAAEASRAAQEHFQDLIKKKADLQQFLNRTMRTRLQQQSE